MPLSLIYASFPGGVYFSSTGAGGGVERMAGIVQWFPMYDAAQAVVNGFKRLLGWWMMALSAVGERVCGEGFMAGRMTQTNHAPV